METNGNRRELIYKALRRLLTRSPGPFRATFLLPLIKPICYPKAMVRSLYGIVGVLVLGLLAGSLRAEAFKLTSGETVNGEILPTTANEQGVKIKVGEGDYQNVPWSNFSQDDLKNFSKN